MPLAVENSKDTFLRNVPMNLLGPPGVGKTFCAATFSEHFNAQRPVHLKDMLWILVDPGGLDGLTEQGLTVDVLDISGVALKDVIKTVTELGVLVPKLVAEKKYRAVVLDTASMLARMVEAAHFPNYEKWGLWSAIGRTLQDLVHRLRGTGANMISIFHMKTVSEAADKSAAAKQEAAGLEAGEATLDIAGSSLNVFRGLSSLTLPVRRVKKPDGSTSHIVMPRAYGVDAKSRFACLADKEPADLRAIFNKVRTSTL